MDSHAKPKYAKPTSNMTEYEHSQEEVLFMNAMQAEKQKLGRMLTCVDILRVAHRIGYRKIIDVEQVKQIAEKNNG